jgi:GTP cyclohydrolase FolE2
VIEEIEIYQDDPIERPRKGYELHSEEFLICASCQKKLVSILIVKTDCEVFKNVDIIKFITNCPSCKQKSIVKRFDNVKVYFQAIEPYSIVDTELIPTGNAREQRCNIILQ